MFEIDCFIGTFKSIYEVGPPPWLGGNTFFFKSKTESLAQIEETIASYSYVFGARFRIDARKQTSEYRVVKATFWGR